MSVPNPEPGLVICYSYLWRYEREAGREESSKARPCVVVLAVEKQDEDTAVIVAPITHSPPDSAAHAVEIPYKVKRSLGLDDKRSWVLLGEVNHFAWPGYDFQPVPGGKGRYDYGFLPPRLFEQIRMGILDLILQRHTSITNRD